ncbi:MAG TPA: inositol monophosphatase family protein [Xanthobacteraceae bacterium]|nr:inositol monophosphatase family protein [Xanthobacteraceae bacterium]
MGGSQHPDLPALLAAVIAAAEAAGCRLVAEFARPQGPRGAGDHADIDGEIEAALRGRLLELLPARWRGEESGVLAGPSAYCWLVDPHDGTRAFLAGVPGSAVSVALLREGVPVLGVVHAPMSPDRGSDTIAWAEGLGHLLRNGVPIAPKLSDRELSAGDIVLLSQAAAGWPVGNISVTAPARFAALPSIAYRLARVAAGDGVAAVSINGPCGWDYAAGHALIRGAGGVLVDEAGEEVTYTIEGESATGHCAGGAPRVARDLVARDWRKVRNGQPIAPRTLLTWPRATGASLERAVGCFIGLIAGDSLGALVEFQTSEEIAGRYPGGVRDLADGGTWGTIAGQPTDDSELALALARTLVARTAWPSEAVAAAYGEWYASRPFDVGGTTGQAFSAAAAAVSDKALEARRVANRSSQSNGALMRCAPIGIWARDPAEAAAAGREDALLSHPHPLCQAASAAYVAAICAGIQGGDRNAMLSAAEAAMVAPEAGALRDCVARARRGEGPADFVHQQGWILIAFWNAFRHLASDTPLEAALIETVGQGGDTDTNAAICGALLGAVQGRAAIPPRWSTPILACRTPAEAGVPHPRAPRYWPDDVALLAEALLLRAVRLR